MHTKTSGHASPQKTNFNNMTTHCYLKNKILSILQTENLINQSKFVGRLYKIEKVVDKSLSLV